MDTKGGRQAKYWSLLQDIKEKIMSGGYKPGDKLPSENQLSAKYNISRQTVRKAFAILEQDGYIYAEHGRGTFVSDRAFKAQNSKNIAVVTTYLSDYIFPRIIQGIERVLTENGYTIILKTTGNSRKREAAYLQELLTKDVDGIIIEPSKSQIYCNHQDLYAQFEARHIPYVFIQGCFPQMADKPHVLVNDCRGGYLAANYLLSLGHRKIAGIFKADDTQGRERHKGYVQALQEAGIMYDPDYVIWYHTEDRRIKPAERLREMIEQKMSVDAVVCYNDQIAGWVIQALEKIGIRVPEDISVTGFDNLAASNGQTMGLTTIVHPQDKLGEMAAELLMRMLRREEIAPEEKMILVEPELIIRDSCREHELKNFQEAFPG